MLFDPKHKWRCINTNWRISNWRYNCEKLLGVKNDSRFVFDKHIKAICKKASIKSRALGGDTSHITIQKEKVLMNSFFDFQFNYCLLFRMYHSGRNNTNINNLHETYLRLIYCDNKIISWEMSRKR